MITQGYALWAFVPKLHGGRDRLPVVAWCDCDESLGRSGYHPVVAREGGMAKCLTPAEQRSTTFAPGVAP